MLENIHTQDRELDVCQDKNPLERRLAQLQCPLLFAPARNLLSSRSTDVRSGRWGVGVVRINTIAGSGVTKEMMILNVVFNKYKGTRGDSFHTPLVH
jgi:hypothetical protein